MRGFPKSKILHILGTCDSIRACTSVIVFKACFVVPADF